MRSTQRARARDSRPAGSGRWSRRTGRGRARRPGGVMPRGGGVLEHGGVEAAMDEEGVAVAQPGGRVLDRGEGAGAQLGVELRRASPARAASMRTCWPSRARASLRSWLPSRNRPRRCVDQAEHEAQRAGAVRAAIGEVAELDDEAVRRGGIGEGARVAVHVAHHADRGALRDQVRPYRVAIGGERAVHGRRRDRRWGGDRCFRASTPAPRSMSGGRVPGRVQMRVRQLGELGHEAAHIGAVGVEFLALRHRVEDAEEGLRVDAAAGDPLPVRRVVGEVGIDQRVPEPGLALAPVDQQVLDQEGGRRSCARGCASSRSARAGACRHRRSGCRSGRAARRAASRASLRARAGAAKAVAQRLRPAGADCARAGRRRIRARAARAARCRARCRCLRRHGRRRARPGAARARPNADAATAWRCRSRRAGCGRSRRRRGRGVRIARSELARAGLARLPGLAQAAGPVGRGAAAGASRPAGRSAVAGQPAGGAARAGAPAARRGAARAGEGRVDAVGAARLGGDRLGTEQRGARHADAEVGDRRHRPRAPRARACAPAWISVAPVFAHEGRDDLRPSPAPQHERAHRASASDAASAARL